MLSWPGRSVQTGVCESTQRQPTNRQLNMYVLALYLPYLYTGTGNHRAENAEKKNQLFSPCLKSHVLSAGLVVRAGFLWVFLFLMAFCF